jgi:hypothetical protein
MAEISPAVVIVFKEKLSNALLFFRHLTSNRKQLDDLTEERQERHVNIGIRLVKRESLSVMRYES